MYETPLNVTAGLTAIRGLFDLVPRATGARLSRAEVQRPQGATGKPRRWAVLCTQPGQDQPAHFMGSTYHVGVILAC